VTTDFGSFEDRAQSVAIQSNGRIVAAGWSSNGSNLDFALARYLGGPSATSLSINAPSSVPSGSRAKITGTLSSADAACTDTKQVTLRAGTATTTKTTSATGAYTFKTKITEKTTVQVRFAGTASCGPSTSAKMTIKVA